MKKSIYIALFVVLCTGILMTALPNAHAEIVREKGVALIDKKGPNALRLDGHSFTAFVDRYMLVSSRTNFYDENGEPISLDALKTPCQAKIECKKTTSDVPEAVSVHVQHYLDNRPVDAQFRLPIIKPEEPR